MILETAKPECLRCGERIGWIGIGVNLAMVSLKILVGITAGSKACLADALHSSSNIVTAFAIFLSRKMRDRPEDKDHPYGYGKIEFIAAAGVSILIIALTVILVFSALDHVIYKPVPAPHWTALIVAVMSILTNEVMFRYFSCVGTQLRSQTIIANAWANRADCFSSLAVLVGVIGAQLGFHHLDPVAAIFVALVIVKVSVGSIRESIGGLMDRNVPPSLLKKLRKAVRNVEEIQAITFLKARLLGNKIWVDLGIEVDDDYTVTECDEISDAVRARVSESVRGVGQVNVSVDSADST